MLQIAENDKYKEVFTPVFLDLFKNNEVNREFYRPLSTAIVKCFHIPGVHLSEFDKAVAILDCLFACFTVFKSPDAPFKLSDFFHRYIRKKTDARKVLIAVLYGLYYGDVDFYIRIGIGPLENFTYLMLQITAEKTTNSELKHILKELPFAEQIILIANCFKYYREGSYPILKELEAQYRKEKKVFGVQLIEKLRRSFYDENKLIELLMAIPLKKEADLEEISKELDQYGIEQTKIFETLFKTLVPLVVDFPIRLHEEIEKVKQQTMGSSYRKDPEGNAIAHKNHEDLKERFKVFDPGSFTFDDFLNFSLLFGLRGHASLLKFKGVFFYNEGLVDKLRYLINIFSSPFLLTQTTKIELHNFISFVSALLVNLNAFKKTPEIYLQGLDRLSMGVPTKGKYLQNQPILPSLLKGLKALVDYLNSKLNFTTFLENYPIFVFDQSEKNIFIKNQRFIGKLNKQYKARIVHVSLQEAMELAERLQIKPLIDTTLTGQMGFAGARNSIFFLTPVLKGAFYSKGCSSIKDVLKVPLKELNEYMNEFVLGGKDPLRPAGETILMADDDMEIAESNMFSHTLFTMQVWNLFCISPGFHIGRFTKQGIDFLTLKEILIKKKNSYQFSVWDWKPTPAVFSEIICKSLLCVNLPFGSEENQFNLNYKFNYFLRTSIHLGGTRFPVKHIPTNFFVGLEELLQSWIPYALNIVMVKSFLNKKLGFHIFPWNKAGKSESVTSLRELIEALIHPKDVSAMIIDFWSNVRHMLYAPDDMKRDIQWYLLNLLNSNPEEINKEGMSSQELKSIKALSKIYKFYQKDANYFLDYAKRVLACFDNNPALAPNLASRAIEESKQALESEFKIRIMDYPLTQSFYLLARSIGAGEFIAIIKSLISRKGRDDRDLRDLRDNRDRDK